MRTERKGDAVQPPPDDPAGDVALLGCRTCEVVEQVRPDDLRLRVIRFFDEHGEGHSAWIDLSGGAIQLPKVDQRDSS